ncbi:MAG: YHS domain-containing protein [Bacteroidetes bacterium]|nr:YHS domain-containing protein [Bacteroidota bacterium]
MSDQKETTLSFLIADLAGYTALTEIHGDQSALELIEKYLTFVQQSLSLNVSLVERVGDEVLIVSEDSDSLADTALKLLDKIEDELHFPSLHLGLHTGPVIKKNGKYFGHTINLTSRICSYSKGGQILCSQKFINSIKSKFNYNLMKIGNVIFKNVREEIVLYSIVPKINKEYIVVDPVCHMQLDKRSAPIKLTLDRNDFYFCSHDCKEKFNSFSQ